MIAGLSGPLLSHDGLEGILRSGLIPGLLDEPPAAALRSLRALQALVRNRMGPSFGARAVFDLLAEPLARTLGFGVVPLSGGRETVDALLQAGAVPSAAMIVTAWGHSSGGAWRYAVHRGLAHHIRWCLCVSGPSIRLFDVGRAYSRRYAEFDLDAALEDSQTLSLMWGLLRPAAMLGGPGGALLDRAVALCEEHRVDVRRALRDGVLEALSQLIPAFRQAASRHQPRSRIFDELLVVIHRVLFLLFAEARGLVPAWHPLYRNGYTIEALRRQLHDTGAVTGIWEALQAVARLAHRGCRAGSLRVPPFNGRLFSPSDAPLADTVPLDDALVARALRALTTRKGQSGPEAISYADLGVEQLGSVYEHLLDYDLASSSGSGAPAVLIPTGRRKATGTFYTPRSLTDFLVRRTLAPLVQTASPDRILSLRVLDPAMGSGAFLVAACRYLATAYEQALVRDGVLTSSDVNEDDRADFRRAVAQQCLFGVDVNPMAVQLGRLSLWLATLAANKPLSFLDHRLRSGNSLVGASIEDILLHPAPGQPKRTPRALPLFQMDDLQASIERVVQSRRSIADAPDDTLEQVRRKERTLSSLNGTDGPLHRWKSAADVWCAAWHPDAGESKGRAVFGALLDRVLDRSSALPAHVSDPLVDRARQAAVHHGFFHWPFEFPEIFSDEHGVPRSEGGFDAIIGNPPWEMLRDDGGAGRRRELLTFVRSSGVYSLQGRGHGNLYQLFLERTLQLLRRGGRSGLILPGGLATDHAAGPLRRFLFDRTSIDTYTTLDNADGIFPIHRALRFLLLTFTRQGSTMELPSRTGIRSAEALDGIPDTGSDPEALRVPRALIESAGGAGLAVPHLRTRLDLDIVSSVLARTPALGELAGWGIHFGRELNATDDLPHFRTDGRGLPVLEGKLIRPFAADTAAARRWIPEQVAARLLDANATYRQPRLAYRDVASATNRMTLIAAIVPAGVVTTHTIQCLKEPLDAESQAFLCGVFNSYVANYFVRMQVGTHVNAAIIERLPVPRISSSDPLFHRISMASREARASAGGGDVARLNADVARVYGLSPIEFEHVLDTFPLVPLGERRAALRALVGSAVS